MATDEDMVDVPPAGSDQRTATAGPTGPGNAAFPVCLAFRPTCPHTWDDGVGDADTDNEGVTLLLRDSVGVVLLESEIVGESDPVLEIVGETEAVTEMVIDGEGVSEIDPVTDGVTDDVGVGLSDSDVESAQTLTHEPTANKASNHCRSLDIFTRCRSLHMDTNSLMRIVGDLWFQSSKIATKQLGTTRGHCCPRQLVPGGIHGKAMDQRVS